MTRPTAWHPEVRLGDRHIGVQPALVPQRPPGQRTNDSVDHERPTRRVEISRLKFPHGALYLTREHFGVIVEDALISEQAN